MKEVNINLNSIEEYSSEELEKIAQVETLIEDCERPNLILEAVKLRYQDND